MVNPSEYYPNPGSYDDVLERMTRRMRQNDVSGHILRELKTIFAKELQKGVILSRPDRKRLHREVVTRVLTDALRSISGADENGVGGQQGSPSP